MKHTTEMGSGAMIYTPSFIEDWLTHSEVDGGRYSGRQTAW
jgi:hypothetical protein